MKLCMLRTLYLRSKPKSSARNFHWWNYHHSDQLVQNAYISWLVLIRHQISTLRLRLKTSKLLCYNESHYYQTCKRQKSKRDTRRYNYEEDSEDDDDNLTEDEEEEDEVFQVNFLEHR